MAMWEDRILYKEKYSHSQHFHNRQDNTSLTTVSRLYFTNSLLLQADGYLVGKVSSGEDCDFFNFV